MVQIGLLPEKELERFKAKLEKQRVKDDIININQAKFTKSVVTFALLYFNPLKDVDSTSR